tara:strand:+ start:35011 stop:35187 length:177 start_codon:yes stop_codon:yes gene_type:complete
MPASDLAVAPGAGQGSKQDGRTDDANRGSMKSPPAPGLKPAAVLDHPITPLARKQSKG